MPTPKTNPRIENFDAGIFVAEAGLEPTTFGL